MKQDIRIVFFLDSIAEGGVLLRNSPVEDILPSFTFVIALEGLTAEQQKYLQVIVAICSLAFDTKVLWCLPQCVCYLSSAKAAAVPRDLQGFFIRELQEQNKSQGLNLSHYSIYTFPFLSTIHPENDLVPLCSANARMSWQSFCADRVIAIKCPTAAFGDCYKGW